MIFRSNQVRIMVATNPVDFRKGHDGLAAVVQSERRKDPFTGIVFVFRAKRADRLKLLYWDGSGLVMTYKRLEETAFTWPKITNGLMSLNHPQFEALFSGLDWQKVKALEGRFPAAPLMHVNMHCRAMGGVNQADIYSSILVRDLIQSGHDTEARKP